MGAERRAASRARARGGRGPGGGRRRARRPAPATAGPHSIADRRRQRRGPRPRFRPRRRPRAPSSANAPQQQTIERDHACSQPTNQRPDHRSRLARAAVLSDLGVLRRPPLPADPTNRVLHSIGWDMGRACTSTTFAGRAPNTGAATGSFPRRGRRRSAPSPPGATGSSARPSCAICGTPSPAPQARALHAQQDQLSTMRSETEHRAGICFIEIGLHVRPHPGAVGFGCAPAPRMSSRALGGNGSGYQRRRHDHLGHRARWRSSPLTAHFPASAAARRRARITSTWSTTSTS